jgi:hypothetical protein
MTFKVGDRVQVLEVSWNPAINGYTGTIVKVPKKITEASIIVKLDQETNWDLYYFSKRDLICINKTKELL